MITQSMRKIELHVLSYDIDKVLEYLGKKECFQVERFKGKPEIEDSNDREMAAKLEDTRAYLCLDPLTSIPWTCSLPKESDFTLGEAIVSRVNALRERETESATSVRKFKEAVDEATAFVNLNVPYKELEHLTFLSLRIGRLDPARRQGVQTELGDRAVLIPLDDTGRVVAASSKKGRFALDSELKKADFASIEVPKDFTGIPEDVMKGLQERLSAEEARLAGIIREKESLASELREILEKLRQSFEMGSIIEKVKDGLESTQLVYRIFGWIPKAETRAAVEELERITENRIAIRIFSPEELESVKSGAEKVPVKLMHGSFVSSFERLVFSYGAPLYGTIDPTPLVAFFFVFLFAIMFGDLGQGIVILLAGFLLRAEAIPSLKKWKKFSPIVVAVGIGSMTMGFLEGSIFTFEGLLVPLTRALTGATFGTPIDRFITIMPENGAVTKLFIFFGFTVGIGVLINSIGLFINIYNNFSLGHIDRAIFGKTGLSGALFFWYAIFFGVRVGFGGKTSSWDVLGFGLPLLLLFFGEPLHRLMAKKRPLFENGIFTFVIQGIVEILESFSYYLSNTASFLRVGAFALSHAVLSFVVFAMGDLVRQGPTAGVFFQILIVVIGNTVILVLEGMVVAIQIVRLQYYEFFSKFFTETGVEFKPFDFKRGIKE